MLPPFDYRIHPTRRNYLNSLSDLQPEGRRAPRKSLYIPIWSLIIIIIFAQLFCCNRSLCQETSQENSRLDEFRANAAVDFVRDWSARFGRDIHYGTQEATCLRSIREQYDPARIDRSKHGDYKASIISIDWTRQHNEIVNLVSTNMGWHRQAVENIAREAEYLAGNYTYQKNLTFEYVDVHRLSNIADQEDTLSNNSNQPSDSEQIPSNGSPSNENPSPDGLPIESDQEMGQLDSSGEIIGTSEAPEPLPKPSALVENNQQNNETALTTTTSISGDWQTEIKNLTLQRHKNFDEVLINLEESAVHIPVHIFPGDYEVMNGIAWSDPLTKVFRDNFIRNPKLTNQYFSSQNGFMRLYPAQKWPIPRTDPDLYDARMRPWYVAAASSRKDVIILVDSSGSMTGSRRDIAKGVVFEILDTLTDNDHFLILKFSDLIQQVGVPGCSKLRVERKPNYSRIPIKNTMFHHDESWNSKTNNPNETDIEAFYMLPATGKNVRHIKSNFTIPTAGIANFSKALTTAFEVLRNYQDNSEQHGSQCNQAIMLITDGSPSDFEDIFNRYNYPNAPVRVFTYLIGREAGDVTHTKMMACHNRGYYTHVINLAEVRETVQQYIPVMARPLVLAGAHPITWTPAYGELTYQILTDWIWESKRREKARAILAANGRGSTSNAGASVRITSSSDDSGSIYSPLDIEDGSYSSDASDSEGGDFLNSLDELDLFGYNKNNDCFWETRRNDLLTTVVQPVYDRKNESVVTEKYLVKNVWTIKETVMRTAQILGVAAADMKINDIIELAPSYKLGANGYSIMLTNNGFAMHHPNLRSILEPFDPSDPSQRQMKILKPFYSSLDLTQVEHILDGSNDPEFLSLRKEAVSGLTGWRELLTKRALDCRKRVQSRRQSFYFKPIQQFPTFSFMISIPQPYGSHRVEAQIEIKVAQLPEKLTTYFTTSEYDLWTVHPEYSYCDGPSNNTITTILDVFQRIENDKRDDIQWRATESTKPPLFVAHKIVCDKDLLQSLVYDAVATFGFSENCGPPSPNAESSLLGMMGVRFSFVVTRNGLTRVRHFDTNDITVKREALAFAKKHNRAVDETFYSRTVDYNMLINDTATLIQVPFNNFEKIRDRFAKYEADLLNSSPNDIDIAGPDSTPTTILKPNLKDMSLTEKLSVLTNSSIHMIATQTIIVNEGTQKAVAGVSGVFYDYATFVMRFFNLTNDRYSDGQSKQKPPQCYSENPTDEICDESKTDIKCGNLNDTIDCLLIDNNGYIVVSEDLEFIGRHLKAYEPAILNKLINLNVFHEVNITDYQAVCMRQEEKQQTSNAPNSFRSVVSPFRLLATLANNFIASSLYLWTMIANLSSQLTLGSAQLSGVLLSKQQYISPQQPMLSLLPNKTYLRPCEKTSTLYETRTSKFSPGPAESYTSRCNCQSWFAYEQVPKTNLIMLIVDSSTSCRQSCLDQMSLAALDPTDPVDIKHSNTDEQVCSVLERESQLYKKRLETCFSHHSDEEHIKICGGATKSTHIHHWLLTLMIFISLSATSTKYFCSFFK